MADAVDRFFAPGHAAAAPAAGADALATSDRPGTDSQGRPPPPADVAPAGPAKP
jgi:hypothetical protein